MLVFFTLQEVFASQMAIWQALFLLALPLLITFPIVFAASIIFGLPLTFLLKSINRESLSHYCLIGASIGFVITIVGLWLLEVEDGYWIVMLGGVAGGVTGYTWWTSARKQFNYPSDSSSIPMWEEK